MIIGAFLFGASISVIPRFKTDIIIHKVRGISYGFFVPFFFIDIGFQFNFNALQSVGLFAVILLIGLIISQIIGGFIGGKFSGFNARDSVIIGISLIPRNELALVVTSIGVGMNILKQELFSALVLMAIVTTIATPMLLRLAIKKEVKNSPKSPPLLKEYPRE
jgi:Kef-type K+ transport system membrane component KefB